MRRFVFASALIAIAAASHAADLKLSYVKTSLTPTLFEYTMKLEVDTSASAFTPGMGWAWLIFGDVVPGPSPIADFAMTSSFPVGPWTSLTSSSGGHNGPTFASPVAYWTPALATDFLTWTGTSSYDAPDNTLLFSTILVTGGATASNFEIMTVAPVPEPATIAALGLGAIALLRRRKK